MGDTIKPRLIEAGADLSRVMVIDDTEEALTLSDDRIEKSSQTESSAACNH